MTFAEILKAKREAAGMTRMGLARLAELTPSSITLYEQGKREPSWSAVQRLADALDLSTEVFRTPQTVPDPDAPPRPRAGRPRRQTVPVNAPN